MSASGPTSQNDSFSQFNCSNFQERLKCEKGAWNEVLCVKFQHERFFPSNPSDAVRKSSAFCCCYLLKLFFIDFWLFFLPFPRSRLKGSSLKKIFSSRCTSRDAKRFAQSTLAVVYRRLFTGFRFICHFLPLFQQARHHNYIFASQHFNCEWKISLENFSACVIKKMRENCHPCRFPVQIKCVIFRKCA